MNKTTYGSFTEDSLEYVVKSPEPPRDWFNFFWNPTYLACASQNMNGMSLFQDEAGVVTNLFGKQDMRDDPRWIYVRDNETGEFWSAGYFPCATEQDEFECRHGLGYSVLRTLKNGIRIEFRLFVPRRESCEIWRVRVINESKKKRNLSIFTVSNIMLDGVNMPYGYFGGLSGKYEEKEGFLFFKNLTHTVADKKYRAFMYADVPADRWDVSREHFLGRNRNYASPQRVAEGKLGNSVSSTELMVGAMQHNLKLAPRAEKTIHLVLGIVMDLADARRMRNVYSGEVKIEKEFQAMKKANLTRLGDLTLASPDKDLDPLINVWLKHQLQLMADWARFYFKGYRDTCQDSAGMSVLDPARAFEMLKKALRNQRSDGFCPRAFRVPSMDIGAADKHYADSPSWISHATDTLIRETGDLALLEEVVEYSDKGEDTVWQHNLKAMEFLWNDRGAHGLSLIHYGDWNDLIDKAGCKGKGEGVWMSFALARVLKLVGQLATWRGDKEIADLCTRRHKELSKAILKHGWDGERFIYAITDDGKRIGTHSAIAGQIFINPQSWALLSGVVDAKTYIEIAEKIEPIVDTPVGPVHSWPPFSEYDPSIGQLTGTPPGFYTNGNVYCHAASFKVAADYAAGRNDKAFDTLKRILPSADKSEPFAQANGYVGPTAQRLNRHVSDDPWRTGTIAWNILSISDQLFGFNRTLEGFRLCPKLPSHWNDARVVRPFRGVRYEIEFRRGKNPRIEVDGKAIEGNLILCPIGKPAKKKVKILCEIAPESTR